MMAVIRTVLAFSVVMLLCGPFFQAAAQEPRDRQLIAHDTLLITPTTQGTFLLPETGVTVEIGYASVTAPARLIITQQGAAYNLAAANEQGMPLTRFEMPLVISFPPGDGPFPLTATAPDIALAAVTAESRDQAVTAVIGWPGEITLAPTLPADETPGAGHWLVVFDAHGIYARPAWDVLPGSVVYLGPLEHFSPALVEPVPSSAGLRYEPSPPAARSIRRIGSDGTLTLPTAAHAPRYADRFIPEDLRNPGGFALLGWAESARLPDVVRALRATIPNDPDLPAPGVPRAPLDLILPFDCTQHWVISWGYHHSTPQNRFAVDFAAETPTGTNDQPVYAAHTGTLFLKRYGTPDHMIDVGLSARVLADDGITSTVYGHLDPAGTLARWTVDDLPDYTWIEVGPVRQGQMIGIAGRTGYATGAHIHFVLWAWDQSLYQPIPLGPLDDFPRGLRIPVGMRPRCEVYEPF